jgi:hypothetical protein
MNCYKYILTNTGTTISTFTYRRCDDTVWQYQVELDSNQTLVTATWRGENLWYLVRQRTPNEKPQESSLKENSSFGLIQGEVIFKEK